MLNLDVGNIPSIEMLHSNENDVRLRMDCVKEL